MNILNKKCKSDSYMNTFNQYEIKTKYETSDLRLGLKNFRQEKKTRWIYYEKNMFFNVQGYIFKIK